MSSHHIVREKQEPALLVLSLENFAEELLGQLLEWSPTVIAIPGAAEKLESMGVKVDWIIADSLAGIGQPDVKLLNTRGKLPADAALLFLISNSYPSVNIITTAELEAFSAYTDKITLVIYSGTKKIYPVSSGFSKWKPAGEVIEIFDTSGEPEFEGLKNTGGKRYVTMADGFFCVRFPEPFLFLSEEL